MCTVLEMGQNFSLAFRTPPIIYLLEAIGPDHVMIRTYRITPFSKKIFKELKVFIFM